VREIVSLFSSNLTGISSAFRLPSNDQDKGTGDGAQQLVWRPFLLNRAPIAAVVGGAWNAAKLILKSLGKESQYRVVAVSIGGPA
jgi:hypothetical protein